MQRASRLFVAPIRQARGMSGLANLTDGVAAKPSQVKAAQEVFQAGGVCQGAANPTFLKGSNDKAFVAGLGFLAAVGGVYVITGLTQFFTGSGKRTPGA